jgi:hypothetical protein
VYIWYVCDEHLLFARYVAEYFAYTISLILEAILRRKYYYSPSFSPRRLIKYHRLDKY